MCMLGLFASSQDLTQIGKAKLLTVGGGVSANSVFYDGTANRDAFSYVVNGNLNFNISGIHNIPLTFSYTNNRFTNNQPFKFNRLSIHPSYKWVATHIGDVSMTFSPYTLSGHLFTGLGVDLTPEGRFKISAMYGRLLRAVEFNEEEENNQPTYRRMGYGAKAAYSFDFGTVGLTYFTARDETSSLENPIPIELEVRPQENTVVSVDGAIKLFDRGTLNLEYAVSALTEDTEAEAADGSKGILSFLVDEKTSTVYYDALRADLTYSVGNGNVGVGYERIDPDYRTLGAYFFNNDFENITLNASQSLFNNKLSVSFSGGLQQDNLDNTKETDFERVVTAVNLGYNASERLNITGSYSNFQSFTNIRDQFDYINQVTEFEVLDTLNFRQVSQSANMNASYALSKNKERPRSLNLNVAYQDTKDLQEQIFTGATNTVGDSQFYNTAASYTMGFPERDMTATAAINATFNETIDASSTTIGPTLAVNKQFFDRRLRGSFSSSFNTSTSNGDWQNSIFNVRMNAGYQLFEKHQFNFSALTLFNNSTSSTTRDFTVTLGYNYSFTVKRPRINFRRQVREQGNTENRLPIVKLRYRGKIYQGNAIQLAKQIGDDRQLPEFQEMPPFKKDQLDRYENDLLLVKTEGEKQVRTKALDYLEALYDFSDFASIYDTALYEAVQNLKSDAERQTYDFEQDFLEKLVTIQRHEFKGKKPSEVDSSEREKLDAYIQLYEKYEEARRGLAFHHFVLGELGNINTLADLKRDEELMEFRARKLTNAYEVYAENQGDIKALSDQMTLEMIKYFEEIVETEIDIDEYILKNFPQNKG